MDFIAEQGLFPGALPKKMALRRAGRSDLEKAVERWGGVARLASELNLEPPSEALQQRWSQFLGDLQEVTGREGDDVRGVLVLPACIHMTFVGVVGGASTKRGRILIAAHTTGPCCVCCCFHCLRSHH